MLIVLVYLCNYHEHFHKSCLLVRSNGQTVVDDKVIKILENYLWMPLLNFEKKEEWGERK